MITSYCLNSPHWLPWNRMSYSLNPWKARPCHTCHPSANPRIWYRYQDVIWISRMWYRYQFLVECFRVPENFQHSYLYLTLWIMAVNEGFKVNISMMIIWSKPLLQEGLWPTQGCGEDAGENQHCSLFCGSEEGRKYQNYDGNRISLEIYFSWNKFSHQRCLHNSRPGVHLGCVIVLWIVFLKLLEAAWLEEKLQALPRSQTGHQSNSGTSLN